MNRSREGTEQELREARLNDMGFGLRPEGDHHDKRMGMLQTTDDRPIFPDNTDWVAPTQSSGATLLANGFKSGSAATPHWPTAFWGETLTMNTNIISSQTSFP
jgi:hypothetical protein